MTPVAVGAAQPADFSLRARFYRFLNAQGLLLTPAAPLDAGELTADEEQQLALSATPKTQQLGYLVDGDDVAEVLTMPIISTATGEAIAALVLGFDPAEWLGAEIVALDPQVRRDVRGRDDRRRIRAERHARQGRQRGISGEQRNRVAYIHRVQATLGPGVSPGVSFRSPTTPST